MKRDGRFLFKQWNIVSDRLFDPSAVCCDWLLPTVTSLVLRLKVHLHSVHGPSWALWRLAMCSVFAVLTAFLYWIASTALPFVYTYTDSYFIVDGSVVCMGPGPV